MDVVRQPVKPKHNNITNYFLVTATSVLQLYYASAIKYLNTNERVVCSFVLCRFLWTHSVYTAFMHQLWTVRYKSFFFKSSSNVQLNQVLLRSGNSELERENLFGLLQTNSEKPFQHKRSWKTLYQTPKAIKLTVQAIVERFQWRKTQPATKRATWHAVCCVN